MKNLILLSLLFSSFLSLSLSKKREDSLQRIASSTNTPLLKRLDAYVELSKNAKNSNATNAIAYAADAILLIGNSSNYDKQLAQLYQYKGEAYVTNGQRDSGIYYYLKAVKIADKIQDLPLLAASYNTIARFYRRDNPDRAITYYDKAMNIYDKLKDDEGRATILNESGVAYENKKDFDEAIRRYSASLSIQQQRKDEVGIGYSLEFLAGGFLQKNELDKAEYYVFEALKSRKKTRDTFALSMNYSSIASIYAAKKQWSKATAYYDTSNQLATLIHYPNLLSYNYKELAGIYQQQENYQRAFDAMEKHNLYKDSLFTIEKEKNIEELNARYETEIHKRQIQEQQFAIAKRNYWIAAIVFLLFTALTMAFLIIKRNREKQNARLQAAILEQQEQATKAIIETEEKERQRIAMDLHDGVGQMMSAARINLANLEGDISFNDDISRKRFGDVLTIVDDSCKELRNVSHNMIPNGLLKNSLAIAVRDFLNKINSVIEVSLFTSGLDNRLDTSIETVLYRVIQECVNNVIKHAQANRLDISIINEDAQIVTTIEDNGIGFDAKDPSIYKGIGLKNIQTRVTYLKGTIEFDSAPERGTVAIITVPL